MSKDIIDRLRKNLNAESKAIFEEYKEGLKQSLQDINENMKTKVDQFNLDEFARKYDLKLYEQISGKLDKNDLKKQTNTFQKKIQSLESRISKALVETLLDVQGADGPLLATGPNPGKCVSCNQRVSVKPEDKYRLKKIHDNAVKIGTGGYSRVLAKLEEKEVSQFKKTHSELPKLRKKPLKKQFEEASRTFSKALDEELKKDKISGERIIRRADKIYDTLLRSTPSHQIMNSH